MSEIIKIFYSYSHDDIKLRKKLDNHLAFLRRDKINSWYDGEIIAGKDLDNSIQKELSEADIILLLVSSSFLSSFYCYEVEMKAAMNRHENKTAVIVPVLLSDCVWQKEPFAKLLMTPHDAKPINNKKHWATIDEAFTDVAKSLEKTVDDVKKEKAKKNNSLLLITENNPQKKEKMTPEAIEKSMALLKQEVKELNYNSTKEDIAKIHNLKVKFYDEYLKEIDNQIDFIVSKKELMYSPAIFDTIYTSEKIDQITAGAIQKIREDNETYKWYDRSLLVSALSLSLINFKFDSKKANLLLDFVTDFEPKVWERALTGLIIAIIYQKNRAWLRDNNFVHKLETLQNNEQVQEGLKTIDFILKNELYKYNLYNTDLFKQDLFKSPMSSFVPFYNNNSVLKEAIDSADNDFEVDDFKIFLDEIPILDSHKYFLCISLISSGLKKEKIEKDKVKIINNSLTISNNFSPFQNLISEYYFFFNYFPEKLKDDVFKNQLLLTKTDLKKHVLNKVNNLLLEANTLKQNESFKEAISIYNDLLRIEPTHKDAQWQLGISLFEIKENEKALDSFLKLETQGINDNELLYRIALCYYGLKDYVSSNSYCVKIEKKDKNPKFHILILMAENNDELFEVETAYSYCKKAEKVALDEDDFYELAAVYSSIEKNEDALRIIEKTSEKDAKHWRLIGIIYCEFFNWEQSIFALEKSKKMDAKGDLINLSLARTYLLSKKGIEKSKILFDKELTRNIDYKAIIYGNLGHFYLIKGDLDNAFSNYIKCIELLENSADFNKKMNSDLKFMLNLQISQKTYNSLKNRVIKQYDAKDKN